MPAAVAPGPWKLDPDRSTVALRHRTMWGLVTVKGVFGSVSGQAEVGPDGSATGTVTLDAASLDTRHAKRDAHLRSADFFDAERHPALSFAVLEAVPDGGDAARVTGELTVRGVTRPRTLTALVAADGPDAVTLTAELTVDRAEFGMGWNQLGMMRGPAVVTAELRFTRG